MASEDACEHDMLVQIRWQGRKVAVPLSQLTALDPDESTDEAIGDWHYWVRANEFRSRTSSRSNSRGIGLAACRYFRTRSGLGTSTFASR